MPLITVFTPTYNRKDLIASAYKSLQNQSYKDFEWIIVDDGSNDRTNEYVDSIIRNIRRPKFNIRYFYKQNGGKHTAINIGVKEAGGELFLILDSDDYLPVNSLEIIDEKYEQIKENSTIGGICGYMSHRNGQVIGSPIINCITDSVNLRYKYNVKGDMCEVFRTSVLREFPFPEIKGERFCPEALVWNRIAQKYKLQVISNVIYYRDYIEGGLTSKIVKIRMQSPIASMMTYQELTQYQNVSVKERCKAAINYWRFRLCMKSKKNKYFPKIKSCFNVFAPLGFLMHIHDLILNK